jgi:glucose-1-phosphate thymidylyltransferase
MGTHESLVNATNLIKLLEENQSLKIACLEEIAYLNKWITKGKLLEIADSMKNNQYGEHLLNVASNDSQKKLTLRY